MTMPRGRAGSGRGRAPAPRIRPSQVVTLLVVLGLFVIGLVVSGTVGGSIVAVLSLAAGAWLAVRWGALPERVRIFRAGVVLIGLAVAVSLFFR